MEEGEGREEEGGAPDWVDRGGEEENVERCEEGGGEDKPEEEGATCYAREGACAGGEEFEGNRGGEWGAVVRCVIVVVVG